MNENKPFRTGICPTCHKAYNEPGELCDNIYHFSSYLVSQLNDKDDIIRELILVAQSKLDSLEILIENAKTSLPTAIVYDTPEATANKLRSTIKRAKDLIRETNPQQSPKQQPPLKP